MNTNTSVVDEIRTRWASRKWPTIGYFVHGQAYEDIQTLLAIITLESQTKKEETNVG